MLYCELKFGAGGGLCNVLNVFTLADVLICTSLSLPTCRNYSVHSSFNHGKLLVELALLSYC